MLADGTQTQAESVAAPVKALIYIRVGARTKRPKTRVQQQRIKCRRMAERLGCTNIDQDFIDHAPGDTLDRPGLQQLMWHISTRQVAYVICADTAQLSSDPDQFIDIVATLGGYGTQVALAGPGSTIDLPHIED